MAGGSYRRIQDHRPRRARQAARLHAEGATMDEIAEKMGVGAGRAKSLVQFGKQKPGAKTWAHSQREGRRERARQRENERAQRQAAEDASAPPLPAGWGAYLICSGSTVLGRGWGLVEGDVLTITQADRLDDAFQTAQLHFNAATGAQIEDRRLPLLAIPVEKAPAALRHQVQLRNLVCMDASQF